MPHNDGTKTPVSKIKRPPIDKRLSRNKSTKLKSSSWYEQAARSVQISKKRAREERGEAIE